MSFYGAQLSISNFGIGGDFQIDSTGQPIIAVDTDTDDPALQQKMVRLLYTKPTLVLDNVAIGDPDDQFNPTFGAALGALVDELDTPELRDFITTKISNGLATFVDIDQSTSPQIVFDSSGDELLITITYTRITGEVTALPPMTLSAPGG